MKATSMEQAQAKVNRLWKKMCAEEGVPVDSKFVVFTATNKFSKPYQAAVNDFFYIKRQIELGAR